MNTDSGGGKGLWGWLGLSPESPYGKLFVAGCALFAIAFIVLLGIALLGAPAATRYAAAILLLFVASLSPIPLALLIIFGRREGRIKRILGGDYWAKWEYDSSVVLAANQGREVLLGANGIYWPARGRLCDFARRLTSVDLQQGETSQLVFKYVVSRGKYGQIEIPEEEIVPVPRGKEAEAEALVTRFRHEGVGKPSPNYADQWAVGLVMGGVILAFVVLWIPLGLSLESANRAEESNARSTTSAIRDATSQAVLTGVLQTIRPVIEGQIARWQAQSNLVEQHLSAAEAGFGPGDNVQEVVYGRCAGEKFYVLVLQIKPAYHTILADTDAIGYSSAAYSCAPEHWDVIGVTRIEGDWYAAGLNTARATAIPLATQFAIERHTTLTPTASPEK